MRFGDSYAKQIEKKKKVLEVLTARLEDVQKRIDDYRREKQKAPKSNAGKLIREIRVCRQHIAAAEGEGAGVQVEHTAAEVQCSSR